MPSSDEVMNVNSSLIDEQFDGIAIPGLSITLEVKGHAKERQKRQRRNVQDRAVNQYYAYSLSAMAN